MPTCRQFLTLKGGREEKREKSRVRKGGCDRERKGRRKGGGREKGREGVREGRRRERDYVIHVLLLAKNMN